MQYLFDDTALSIYQMKLEQHHHINMKVNTLPFFSLGSNHLSYCDKSIRILLNIISINHDKFLRYHHRTKSKTNKAD
jgi:hypothetical protein